MKIIKILVVSAVMAFLVHTVFTQWYENGAMRFISPLLFFAYAAVLIAFIRRKQWSWKFVASIAIADVTLGLIFWPEPSYFGEYLAFARILAAVEIALLSGIAFLMTRRSTQEWFNENVRLTMTFDIGSRAVADEKVEVSKAIRITTTINGGDLLLLLISDFLFPGWNFWINVVIALFLTWFVISWASFSLAILFSAAVFCILLWCCLVIFELVLSFVVSYVRWSMKKGMLGEHRFLLSDDGLVEETLYNRTLHSWSSVKTVRKFFGAAMVQVENGWHIFPHRTFDANLTRDQFARMITSYRTI